MGARRRATKTGVRRAQPLALLIAGHWQRLPRRPGRQQRCVVAQLLQLCQWGRGGMRRWRGWLLGRRGGAGLRLAGRYHVEQEGQLGTGLRLVCRRPLRLLLLRLVPGAFGKDRGER